MLQTQLKLYLRVLHPMDKSESSYIPVVIAEEITTKGHVRTRMNVYHVRLNYMHTGLRYVPAM